MEAGDYSLQEALPCGAVASREAFGKWAAYAFLNGKEIRGQMQDRNRIDAVEKPGPRTAGRRFCAVQAFWAAGPKPWRRANSLRPSI